MTKNHYLNCDAPICQDDKNPNWRKETVWYAGEKVCMKVPYQKFQYKQKDINRLVSRGKFKNIEIPYNANDLETRSI